MTQSSHVAALLRHAARDLWTAAKIAEGERGVSALDREQNAADIRKLANLINNEAADWS